MQRSSRAKMAAKAKQFLKGIDVQHGQPLRTLTVRQTVIPVLMVSMLFFGWGFAYGLLDTMNAKVKHAMHLSGASASLLAVAYYVTYLPVPFWVAGPIIRKVGYRLAFVVGLALFGIGNFVVSAGANTVAKGHNGYISMVIGMFVVGSGISTLERSANTYVVHCGSRKWSALRLNLAQSAAAIGTVVAPLLAAVLLFTDPGTEAATVVVERNLIVKRNSDMASVVGLYQTTGAVVMGIAAVFAWVFFRFHIVPEVSANPHPEREEEPVHQPAARDLGRFKRFLKHAIWREDRLWFAVVANFFNLSCQVAVAQFFIAYCAEAAGKTHAKGSNMLSVAQSAFVVGRLAMAVLCRFFKPRQALLFFICGAVAMTAAAALSHGTLGIVFAIMIMFFEGPLFPSIFATAAVVEDALSSLREDIMIASISGGAVLSPLVGALADGIADHSVARKGTAKAFLLISGAFAIVASYVLAINTKRRYKAVIDSAENNQSIDDVESVIALPVVETRKRPFSYLSPLPQWEPLQMPESAIVHSRGYFGGVSEA